MAADRTEKLTVTRDHTKTVVKVVIVEDGVTVNYSVKTYESQIAKASITAREGAERILKELNPQKELSAVR